MIQRDFWVAFYTKDMLSILMMHRCTEQCGKGCSSLPWGEKKQLQYYRIKLKSWHRQRESQLRAALTWARRKMIVGGCWQLLNCCEVSWKMIWLSFFFIAVCLRVILPSLCDLLRPFLSHPALNESGLRTALELCLAHPACISLCSANCFFQLAGVASDLKWWHGAACHVAWGGVFFLFFSLWFSHTRCPDRISVLLFFPPLPRCFEISNG